MRDLFPGHYRPTDEEFARLWNEGIITFDANVLLNLYRYTSETRDKLFELLEGLDEQIWLPYQAALEFHRNRPTVIREQEVAFEKLVGRIRSLRSDFEEEIDDVVQEGRHPVLDPDELRERVQGALDSLRGTIEGLKSEHPNLLEEDPIRARVDRLFDGRVGEPFDTDRLQEIRDQGSERYENKIPPGYEDEGKEERHRYGDLILWRQVLDKASEEQRPVILVTDDSKEDWWRKAKGQRIGPRPELVEEMRDEAGELFYLYSPESFMSYAADHLEQEVTDETLADVQRVSEQVRRFTEQIDRRTEILQAVENLVARTENTSKALDNLLSHESQLGQLDETQRLMAKILERQRQQQLNLSDLVVPQDVVDTVQQLEDYESEEEGHEEGAEPENEDEREEGP